MKVPPLSQKIGAHRARATKAVQAAPKELRLQADVADVLTRHARPEWCWTHFPAEERRDMRTGAGLKRMGYKGAGQIFNSSRRSASFIGMNSKRVGGRLSTEQEAFRLWCIGHGM
jgi:hypothetical protein